MKASEVAAVFWHTGVLIAVFILGIAVLTRQWLLTLLAAGLTLVLRRTSLYIPLPQVYRELGLTENLVMGGAESDHQRPLR